MSALWSAEQHAWLKVLGHTVYVQGTVLPVAVDVPATDPQREPLAPARAPKPAAPALRPRPTLVAAPVPSSESAPAGVAAIASATRPPSRLPDKLHFALIRASGVNPNAPDAAALMGRWPPAAELRGNAAAKRALWPSLRMLRRSPPP